jgi:hypothetical protein
MQQQEQHAAATTACKNRKLKPSLSKAHRPICGSAQIILKDVEVLFKRDRLPLQMRVCF